MAAYKGFALILVLKVRFFGTRKWPIAFYFFPYLKINFGNVPQTPF